MSHRDEHWESEDEHVVGRLRAGRPRVSDFELDRIKTTVMSRVRLPTRRRAAPGSRLLVAFMTVGLMAAGTAAAGAWSGGGGGDGTGAAQSQYRPPKCNPHHEECKCPDHSSRVSRDRCVCPSGQTFADGKNDCRCPDGSRPTDSGRCVKRSADQGSSPPTQQSASPSSPQSASPSASARAPAKSAAHLRRAHRQRHHHRAQ